jgi:hypothetical protein
MPSTGFLCSKWCLVAQPQFELLAYACRDNSSLSGNLEMLRRRLNPDSIMLVEYKGELDPWRVFEAYDDAETLVGALNMLSLLEVRAPDPRLMVEPTPIFRARYIEHCDLPLVIDAERLWMSGHTTFSWPGLADPYMDAARLSTEFFALSAHVPPVVQRALLREKQPNELQEELELSIRALTAAFQSTSLGQFVAGAVSSLESLLGDTWAKREERLRSMLPGSYHFRLEQLLEARHEFVHAARQPPRDQGFLGLTALAMVVQVWTIIARMPQGYATREDLWYRLRAFENGDLFAAQHARPDQDLIWIHKYLVPTHPNHYQMQYVVRGTVYCSVPSCGQKLGQANVIVTSGTTQRLRCPSCANEFDATIHSVAERSKT